MFNHLLFALRFSSRNFLETISRLLIQVSFLLGTTIKANYSFNLSFQNSPNFYQIKITDFSKTFWTDHKNVFVRVSRSFLKSNLHKISEKVVAQGCIH